MDVKIEKLYSPLTEADLVKFETELNISLPEEYRNFLLTNNGGSPQPDVFPIIGESPDSADILRCFFGIRTDEDFNNSERYFDLRNTLRAYDARVPAELLPIGCDPGGNLVCVAVAGTNRGKIYFWDHEEEADYGEVPTYDNVYFVADSFNKLLDSLMEPPD